MLSFYLKNGAGLWRKCPQSPLHREDGNEQWQREEDFSLELEERPKGKICESIAAAIAAEMVKQYRRIVLQAKFQLQPGELWGVCWQPFGCRKLSSRK